MYVLLNSSGAPVLLDTIEGHAETRRLLVTFAAQAHPELELPVKLPAAVEPGHEPLNALRVRKTGGPLHTAVDGSTLVVSGHPELLARYAEAFTFAPHAAGDEHHPERGFPAELGPGSLLTVIRADDEAGTPA